MAAEARRAKAARWGRISGRRRFRSLLVAGEVALALVLLAGAGLAIRSFERLSAVQPGFDSSNVLSVNVLLPEARYPDAPALARFYRDYVNSLAAQPGIAAAGAVMRPPLSRGGFGGTFSIIGRDEGDDQRMQVRPATPGARSACPGAVRIACSPRSSAVIWSSATSSGATGLARR